MAIDWVRQRGANIIPILGARWLAQLEDNLGVLEFALSNAQMDRLTAASPVPVLYRHTFWNDFVRRDLVVGERVDTLRTGMASASQNQAQRPWPRP